MIPVAVVKLQHCVGYFGAYIYFMFRTISLENKIRGENKELGWYPFLSTIVALAFLFLAINSLK